MNNLFAHSDKTRNEMLSAISKSSVDDLFSQIPNMAKMSDFVLPDDLSELDVFQRITELSKKNNVQKSFLGAGVYNRFVPPAISQIAQRFEFLTAYTPYQPEISQGTLQVMYEFQTMMCRLSGMDICNASVYDAATACVEAIFMSVRISKKNKALVSNKLNPEYKHVIDTYASASEIEIVYFDKLPESTNEYACVMIQMPDFYGEIFEVEKSQDTLLVVVTNLMTLALLKSPAEYGADIVVGDVQPLGIPMTYGGPYAGFIATKEKFIRQLPGRLAGRTLDKEGKTAYTLTIQTREQHIKREKATSNICSNQALIALCATVYLSLLGENGFYELSFISSKNAHALAQNLQNKGIKVLNKNFFNEFVVEVENSDDFLNKLKENGIIGGLKLDENKVLTAVTEMNSLSDIELYSKLV